MNASATVSTPVTPSKKQRKIRTSARTLADLAVRAAIEKKASDVKVMDITEVSGFSDFFVLCTGDSDAQIKAIVDGVQEAIKENCGERAWHVEGYEYRQWVLIDYVDTVVHVFDKERRAFYSLERLWADAPTWDIDEETGQPKSN
jgi:ribosome-associated protein